MANPLISVLNSSLQPTLVGVSGVGAGSALAKVTESINRVSSTFGGNAGMSKLLAGGMTFNSIARAVSKYVHPVSSGANETASDLARQAKIARQNSGQLNESAAETARLARYEVPGSLADESAAETARFARQANYDIIQVDESAAETARLARQEQPEVYQVNESSAETARLARQANQDIDRTNESAAETARLIRQESPGGLADESAAETARLARQANQDVIQIDESAAETARLARYSVDQSNADQSAAETARLSRQNDGVQALTAEKAKAVLPPPKGGLDRSHIVTLTGNDGYILEFLVMPSIQEGRSVEYEAVSPAQSPGSFQKYKGTPSVTWQVNATFIARNTDEASINLEHINRLRGWTMPYFGDRTAASFKTKLGAPPPVLMFKGLRTNMIGPVPVVITSLSWDWPKDVDYIPARAIGSSANSVANIPFPAVMTIGISLVESFSVQEFNDFSLEDYRSGNIEGAYHNSNPIQIPAGNDATANAQPEAMLVRGAFTGSGAADSRRFDQNHLTSTIAKGRGSINPPNVIPNAISEQGFAAFGGT